MGFGMQGMTATQVQYAQSNSPCYADWCSLFTTWAGKAPFEVQTLSATDPTGGATTGALPPILSYVVPQTHAQVLELYPQEWLVADDPAGPPTRSTTEHMLRRSDRRRGRSAVLPAGASRMP
jgi:hypothetical protein